MFTILEGYSLITGVSSAHIYKMKLIAFFLTCDCLECSASRRLFMLLVDSPLFGLRVLNIPASGAIACPSFWQVVTCRGELTDSKIIAYVKYVNTTLICMAKIRLAIGWHQFCSNNSTNLKKKVREISDWSHRRIFI